MVTAAKPKVGGAVHVAPLNTTLPNDAETALAAAFKSLGYISDSGLVRRMELDVNNIKAWGGDVILALDNGKTESFQFTLLDSTSVDTLKLMFGDSNVSGPDLATGISVVSNNTEKPGHVIAIDMIESGNTLHRIVIPNGVVTEIGDITYVDNDAVGFDVTVTAVADSNGNTAYDYLKSA